jgi:TnpA family transposase
MANFSLEKNSCHDTLRNSLVIKDIVLHNFWNIPFGGAGQKTRSSDQFSQYGTKVISSTVRDATYVLDAILDNETDLTILEHTTDTAGYTD